MKKTFVFTLLPVLAAALTIGGVGAFAADTGAQAETSGGGKRVQTGKSRFGTILQDSKGRTLYLFTKEKSSKSRCYGECARAWPPLMTSARPVAIKGAKQGELGTTKRRNGKSQVTYNGHPLYYYVDDAPKEVRCQAVDEFGGIWYVVDRNGNAVR